MALTPEALSNLMLDFYRFAESSDPRQFQKRALERIRSDLAFDVATWDRYAMLDGCAHLQDRYAHDARDETISGGDVAIASRDWLPTVRLLPPDESHPRSTSSTRQCMHGYSQSSSLEAVHEFARAGLVHVLCLHRSGTDASFTEGEREFARQFLAHLIEALGQCRRFAVRRALMRAWETHYTTAVANTRGVLYDAQDQFLAAILREWPDWRGARLPDDLLSHLASDQEWHFAGRHLTLQGRTLGNLRVLVASRPGPLALLTERELAVAQRYAHGESHREIGEKLFIAPATVRNHLRSAYAKLQIRSKSELHALMRGQAPLMGGELRTTLPSNPARGMDQGDEYNSKEPG